MADIIIGTIIVIALILAIGYIIKAKRDGKKCIGCPNSGGCGGKCNKKGIL